MPKTKRLTGSDIQVLPCLKKRSAGMSKVYPITTKFGSSCLWWKWSYFLRGRHEFWEWRHFKPPYCAVIFMLLYHENIWLVQVERSRENILWKQPQKVLGFFYHICVNFAERSILRPHSVCSKLRGFLVISMDCVTRFSSLFSTFPERLRCVLVCLSMLMNKYC